MLLTVNDMGKNDIIVHGPPGTVNYINSLRKFLMMRSTFDLKVVEFDESTTSVSYDEFTFRAVLLKYDNKANESDENTFKNDTLLYFIEVKLKGVFIPSKAQHLGIPKGKLWGELSRGNTIDFNGRIIYPEEVIDQSDISPVVAYLTCPSIGYMPSLLEKLPLIKKYYEEEKINNNKEILCFMHNTPFDVLNGNEYKELLNMLKELEESNKSIINHILINKVMCKQIPPFVAQYALLKIYKKIIPDKISIPFVPADVDNSMIIKNSANLQMLKKYIIADQLMVVHILPTKLRGTTDNSRIIKLPTDEEINESYNDKMIDEVLEKYKWKEQYNNYLSTENLSSVLPSNIKLVFCGTGCALPSKFRNVSGLYMNINNNEYGMFFDCGEGSYGQLYRAYGDEKINEIIKSVKLIYISHNHVDHHLGVSKIVSLQSTSKPITIIGGELLLNYLNEYSLIENRLRNKYNYILVTNFNEKQSIKEIFDNKEDITIQTVKVAHCEDSHAIMFKHNQTNDKPYSILYSGDCNAALHTEQFYKVAENALLMIHEGTFIDNKLADAKFHTTISQVLETGKRLNAYRMITTHFSQRYPKTYLFPNDEEREKAHNGGKYLTANDLLTIPLCSLEWLYNILPIIEEIFKDLEDDEDDDDKDMDE